MNLRAYGFVLLAAGSSSRLGSPKGMLPYGDTTLLGHVLREMRKLPTWPIIVVTGAHEATLKNVAEMGQVTTIHNADWQEGMASSIRCGLKVLLQKKFVDGIIFASCDQPAVSAELFRALKEKRESTGRHIVASAYADTLGIPALFDSKYFIDLQNLSGEKGAKSLLNRFADDVVSVLFGGGEIDIDTLQDYEEWKKL
jgi:molybdenum cofactor cytidylyltransferase